ncbi:MAG: hypothetical protein KAS04_06390, partial [Candidatus Aenigmarchaeota archaeon]|nr:hypothetical protein [Candidatus Aenigmarchaeota archaeon]
MAVAMIGPKFYGWDKNGKPLAFGKLYTKLAGTDIDKDTWTNEDQQVENSNPVILNGEGYADVYLSGSYKMILTDADDNEIWSQDPVSSSSSEEWVNCQAATYVSPTSFKVTGDYTDIYSDSRAVRLDQGEADYQYSFVSSSSFSGGETTVILLESIVLVGLTEVCSSIVGSKSIPAEGVYYFDTIQNLLTGVTATSLKEGDIANIVTFYEDGISGGGTFRYNSTKDKTDHNGGTIIDPGIGITPGAAGWWTSAAPGVGVWERVDYGDPLDLRWFGFGESVTASLNTSAWQAALDLAESYALLAAAGTAIGPGKTVVYIPDGVYSYGTTGVTKALGVSIIGLSREGVRLTYTGIGKAIDVTLNIGDIDESLIDKFTLECSDAATDGIYVSRAQELIIQNLRVDNDNGGGSGIQFYSHCHHSKVLNSRVFGGDYGVRNQRNAAEGRNNSCEFKGLWLDGGISSFFDDDCYATQLINCKSDSRSPSVADINFKNSRS